MSITKNVELLAVAELVSGKLISGNLEGLKKLIEQLTNEPCSDVSLLGCRVEICKWFLVDNYGAVCNDFLYLESIEEIYKLKKSLIGKKLRVTFERYPNPDNDSFFN